jgi:hypothetical protein
MTPQPSLVFYTPRAACYHRDTECPKFHAGVNLAAAINRRVDLSGAVVCTEAEAQASRAPGRAIGRRACSMCMALNYRVRTPVIQ